MRKSIASGIRTEHDWQTEPGHERSGDERERRKREYLGTQKPRGQVAEFYRSPEAGGREERLSQVLERLRDTDGVRHAEGGQDSVSQLWAKPERDW